MPAALFVPGSTEGAQRAAWRRYLAGTVEPAAEMIAAELAAKLEQPVALDVAMLATPDAVTSTARAVNSRAIRIQHATRRRHGATPKRGRWPGSRPGGIAYLLPWTPWYTLHRTTADRRLT